MGRSRVLVGKRAMLVSRLCVLLRFFVLAEIVVVRRLVMMMGGSVVMRGGRVVVLAGLVRRLCHGHSSLGKICPQWITVAPFCDGVATWPSSIVSPSNLAGDGTKTNRPPSCPDGRHPLPATESRRCSTRLAPWSRPSSPTTVQVRT